MPPFRPANLNKRAYPGNASIIGPTCTATLGITTTTCCTSTACCAACCLSPLCLGCRCGGGCACPCCCIVCSCNCTVCARTIPSGRWKASEQYEARTRDAWGDTNCVTGAPTCLCCTNVGSTCDVGSTDFKGFFINCGPEYWYGGFQAATGCAYNWDFCDHVQNVCVGGCSAPCSGRSHPWPTGCHGATSKWFVAPACTQASETFKSSCPNSTDWCALNSAITNMGACGWCIPGRSWMPCFGTPRGTNCADAMVTAYRCRTYWDSYTCERYWTSHRAYIHSWGSDAAGSHGPYMGTMNMSNGSEDAWYQSAGHARCTRAFIIVENGNNCCTGHQ